MPRNKAVNQRWAKALGLSNASEQLSRELGADAQKRGVELISNEALDLVAEQLKEHRRKLRAETI